jgi:hypothetical protein
LCVVCCVLCVVCCLCVACCVLCVVCCVLCVVCSVLCVEWFTYLRPRDFKKFQHTEFLSDLTFDYGFRRV